MKALLLVTMTIYIQAQNLPVDSNGKIVFRDTIITQLDSLQATIKLTDFLLTNYNEVKQNANKAYLNTMVILHKKNMGGNISKVPFGELSYKIITEVRKEYIVITSTNFILQVVMNSNELFPSAGKNQLIGQPKPLEEKRVNNNELLLIMNKQLKTLENAFYK